MIPRFAPQILGIGHKARTGKDTLADWLVENCGYTKLHWADALYEECRNMELSFVGNERSGVTFINVWKDGNEGEPNEKLIYYSTHCPILHGKVWDWIQTRPIGSFDVLGGFWIDKEENGDIAVRLGGMQEKDAVLLQWWGTDFRRRLFGDDYWVNKVEEGIEKENPLAKFVIPDTRFPNEAEAIREWGGVYCDVRRDAPAEPTGRDPNHISEIALDDFEPDFTLDSNGTLSEYLTRIAAKFNHWRK